MILSDQNSVETARQAKLDKHEAKRREADAAMAAYQAEKRAVDAKTERLRAARLAKEAAEREAAANAPVAAPRTRKKKASA